MKLMLNHCCPTSLITAPQYSTVAVASERMATTGLVSVLATTLISSSWYPADCNAIRGIDKTSSRLLATKSD